MTIPSLNMFGEPHYDDWTKVPAVGRTHSVLYSVFFLKSKDMVFFVINAVGRSLTKITHK